jgi:hypothetical protein
MCTNVMRQRPHTSAVQRLAALVVAGIACVVVVRDKVACAVRVAYRHVRISHAVHTRCNPSMC